MNYFYFRFSFIRRKTAKGSDSKFFSTNRKGENHELREELRSANRDRKRDAVKKVFYSLLSIASHDFILKIN